MELVVLPSGDMRLIYSETLDLAAFGQLTIRRASHVEPDERGQWFADLAPVAGPRLGPFDCRSQALAAEEAWLTTHAL
jgi:hypothetical protein